MRLLNIYHPLIILVLSFIGVILNVSASELITASNNITDSISIEYIQKINSAEDKASKMEVLFDYGMYLDEAGELEQSTSQIEKAFAFAEELNLNESIARIGNYLATNYIMMGKIDPSTKTYLKALASAELTENQTEVAKISMNLAENYNFCGDYKNAIKYGINALRIKEMPGNHVRICYHYMTMSNIFKEMGNLAKREEYIKKAYALKDDEECASLSDIAKIYNGLGGVAMEKQEYEKALAYYDTLRTLCEQENFIQGISTALVNSSLIYIEQHNYEKALDLVLKAEIYSDHSPYDTIFSNNCLVDIYTGLGRYHEALTLANQTIKKEELDTYSAEKLKTLRYLYELNYKTGEYEQAYFWNDSLQSYKEKIHDQDIRQSIDDLEARYQSEKKEQQIAMLETQNKLKQQELLIFIASTIILILLILAGVLLYFKNKRENRIHNLELRHQLLRSQMNPHFLFNALGSIQHFMYTNNTEKAASYLGNFASLTRAILEHSALETVTLESEVEMLKNYLELEQMRAENRFSYQIIINPNLDSEFIKVPPMLVQPFIENAIKHGLKNLNYPGKIQIRFYEQLSNLHISIKDNGYGINETKNKSSQGTHRSMSMEIFKERITILSKKLKKGIVFSISDLSETNALENGTLVNILIPI